MMVLVVPSCTQTTPPIAPSQPSNNHPSPTTITRNSKSPHSTASTQIPLSLKSKTSKLVPTQKSLTFPLRPPAVLPLPKGKKKKVTRFSTPHQIHSTTQIYNTQLFSPLQHHNSSPISPPLSS